MCVSPAHTVIVALMIMGTPHHLCGGGIVDHRLAANGRRASRQEAHHSTPIPELEYSIILPNIPWPIGEARLGQKRVGGTNPKGKLFKEEGFKSQIPLVFGFPTQNQSPIANLLSL